MLVVQFSSAITRAVQLKFLDRLMSCCFSDLDFDSHFLF